MSMSKEKRNENSGDGTPKKKKFKMPFVARKTWFRETDALVIIHEPNPKFSLPYTLHIPGEHMPNEFEKHFQNHAVVVPIVDTDVKVTWQLLEKHNPLFVALKFNIIELDGRNYPDQAWNNIAHKLAKMVYKHHEQQEKKHSNELRHVAS